MKPKQSFLVRLRIARRRAMRSPAERPVLERLLADHAKEIEDLVEAVGVAMDHGCDKCKPFEGCNSTMCESVEEAWSVLNAE